MDPVMSPHTGLFTPNPILTLWQILAQKSEGRTQENNCGWRGKLWRDKREAWGCCCLSSPGVTQIDTSWKTVPQTNGLTAMWWWPWYNLAQECSDNIPCLQITGMCWFLSVPVCMEQGKSMFSSIFIIKVFILRGPYGAPKNLQICRSVYQATKPYHKF